MVFQGESGPSGLPGIPGIPGEDGAIGPKVSQWSSFVKLQARVSVEHMLNSEDSKRRVH